MELKKLEESKKEIEDVILNSTFENLDGNLLQEANSLINKKALELAEKYNSYLKDVLNKLEKTPRRIAQEETLTILEDNLNDLKNYARKKLNIKKRKLFVKGLGKCSELVGLQFDEDKYMDMEKFTELIDELCDIIEEIMGMIYPFDLRSDKINISNLEEELFFSSLFDRKKIYMHFKIS